VAKIMAEIDAGAMPVGDSDRLVGMITANKAVKGVTKPGAQHNQSQGGRA
jgi:CBS domain-containing protein